MVRNNFFAIAAYCLLLLNIVEGNASSLLGRKPAVPGAPQGARSLTLTPLNNVAIVGETAVLVCEAALAPPSSRILWGEFISNSAASIISDNEFLLAHPNRDRYRIIHETLTQFHLEISNVTLADGGTYVCQNTLASPPQVYRGEAQLIVLASDPNCTTTSPNDGNMLEGNNHTHECTINFQGGFTPRMTWTGPPPYQEAHSPPNPSSVWSGISLTVDRSMDMQFFQCVTNFTDLGQLPEDSATNVPTYTHTYRSPTMFVYWGTKNLYAIPIKPDYVVGDTVTCYADAFPAAFYQWQNMRTLQLYISQSFTLISSHLGTNDTFRCQAQNLIFGFVYSQNLFINVNVPVPTTPTTPTTTPSTTTAPAVADCSHLAGHWRAASPYADLLLEVPDGGEMGEVYGLFKNQTDTVWVEVIGLIKRDDRSLLGLTAIWPFEQGVTSFTGECHACHGVEVIIGDGMWRAAADSAMCGEGSIPAPHPHYRFYREGTVRSALEGATYDVWQPTKISERLGVNLRR